MDAVFLLGWKEKEFGLRWRRCFNLRGGGRIHADSGKYSNKNRQLNGPPEFQFTHQESKERRKKKNINYGNKQFLYLMTKAPLHSWSAVP